MRNNRPWFKVYSRRLAVSKREGFSEFALSQSRGNISECVGKHVSMWTCQHVAMATLARNNLDGGTMIQNEADRRPNNTNCEAKTWNVSQGKEPKNSMTCHWHVTDMLLCIRPEVGQKGFPCTKTAGGIAKKSEFGIKISNKWTLKLLLTFIGRNQVGGGFQVFVAREWIQRVPKVENSFLSAWWRVPKAVR